MKIEISLPYLGNNLAGPEPGGLVGSGCGSQEEAKEVLQEDMAARGGEDGDEADDALRGGHAPFEVEERE